MKNRSFLLGISVIIVCCLIVALMIINRSSNTFRIGIAGDVSINHIELLKPDFEKDMGIKIDIIGKKEAKEVIQDLKEGNINVAYGKFDESIINDSTLVITNVYLKNRLSFYLKFSREQIYPGDIILIPSDKSLKSRSLKILEAAGFITINNIDNLDYTELNGIILKEIDSEEQILIDYNKDAEISYDETNYNKPALTSSTQGTEITTEASLMSLSATQTTIDASITVLSTDSTLAAQNNYVNNNPKVIGAIMIMDIVESTGIYSVSKVPEKDSISDKIVIVVKKEFSEDKKVKKFIDLLDTSDNLSFNNQ